MWKCLVFTICLPILAQQGIVTDASTLPSLFDERIKLGGWYDVQLSRAEHRDARVDLPHLFLFADARFTENWGAFLELGYRKAPSYQVGDEGDAGLERAYIEYRYGLPLKLRAGKLTTPAGLWKQLQWSIMVDSNSKPLIEDMMFIPNHVTGFSALGKHMWGNLEFNYEGFLAREEGPRSDTRDGGAATGIDLNLTLPRGSRFGGFYADYRNNGEGVDLLAGDRRAALFYADFSLLPHRLSWRSEWLRVTREEAPTVEGWYTRLKWQWRRDLFTNFRLDETDVPLGAALVRRHAQTLTLGWWPLPFLRTRLEVGRQGEDGTANTTTGSVWFGVLF